VQITEATVAAQAK